jgi:hypothetical protein
MARILTLGILLCSLMAATAQARDGGDEQRVRIAAECSRGGKARLDLRARDRGIELRFEVEHVRRGGLWQVTVVQEGRVVWRGRVRASRSGGGFEVRRGLADLSGADRITVRGRGPSGTGCTASATLPGG